MAMSRPEVDEVDVEKESKRLNAFFSDDRQVESIRFELRYHLESRWEASALGQVPAAEASRLRVRDHLASKPQPLFPSTKAKSQ